MACFKYRADEDPVVGRRTSSASSPARGPTGRIGRPEPSMTGLSFSRGGYSRYGLGVPRASGAYTVWRPDHWAFEGTDLALRRRARARATPSSATRSTGATLTIGGRPPGARRTRTERPTTLEVLATAPARLWSRGRAALAVRERARRARTRGRGAVGRVRRANVAQDPAQPRGGRVLHGSRRRARSSTPAAPTGRTGSRAATRVVSASRGTSSTACPRDAVGSQRMRWEEFAEACPEIAERAAERFRRAGAVHARHPPRRRLAPDQPVRARLRGGSPDPRDDVAEPEGARPASGTLGASCTRCTTDRMGTEGDAKIYAPRDRTSRTRSCGRPTARR